MIATEELDFSDDQERFLLKVGVFYMTLLGQGSENTLGIFGPLPVPGYPEFRSLVYVFTIKDKTTTDLRKKGQEYCLLVFFIPQEVVSELPKSNNIKGALDNLIGSINDVSLLNLELIKKAKRSLSIDV